MIEVCTDRVYWSNALVIKITNLSFNDKELVLKEFESHFKKHYTLIFPESVDTLPHTMVYVVVSQFTNDLSIVIPEKDEKYVDVKRTAKIYNMVARFANHIRIRHHWFKRAHMIADVL